MKTKNIFGSLIFILFLVLITTTVKSQETTHTPMGQTVYLEDDWDTTPLIAGWEAEAAQWITTNNSDAIRIAPATSNYNCHSYAWNVTEGGPSTDAWMNQTVNGSPNLSKYWTNDAYTSTSNVSDHEKIFFSSADHSAVTTAASGKVRSKWGRWPRYEHSTAQCPYSTGNLQYYKLVNPTVSGSSEALCNSSQRTFSESSFTNISLNYDWSASAPLTEVSGDGTSSYTVAGSAQSGSALVTLTITTPSGAIATTAKAVWVGPPIISNIFGPGDICPSCTEPDYYWHYYAAVSGATEYNWNIPGDAVAYNNDVTQSQVGIYFDSWSCCDPACFPDTRNLYFFAYNECGYDDQSFLITIPEWCVNYFLMSPNPASDIVEISITDSTSTEATTYAVRITNIFGIPVHSGKKTGNCFTLPVDNLKDGIYIVQVTNGKFIYSKQLVVKH